MRSLGSVRRHLTSTTLPVWGPNPTLQILREPFVARAGRAPKVVAGANEALEATLKSGCSVYVHGAAATPSPLLKAMNDVARAKNFKDIEVSHIHIEGVAPHLEKDGEKYFRDVSFFTGANARAAIAGGYADFVPIFLSEIPLLYRRGERHVDIALISVSPPDSHGFCSLGPSVDVCRSALQVAKSVIAVVNPRMPRVFGDGTIHISNLDYVLHHDAPLHGLREKETGAAEEAIGKLIAQELVRDGATLQLGIGAIPDAVLEWCKDHKELGIHSEMISDGVVGLVNSGVITNNHKASEMGKVVAGFAIGTPKLYNWMNDNASLLMLDIAYTNDTAVIRRHPKMTAINSAIEVDITGQVASDSIGTRIYSGVGGQMDFIRGASLCPDGRPIIALPSTTRRGESRIVSLLKPGAGVVTTRAHVHFVVTEHGIAYLFGKSLRERAKALIGIAAPEHRDALKAAARERCLL